MLLFFSYVKAHLSFSGGSSCCSRGDAAGGIVGVPTNPAERSGSHTELYTDIPTDDSLQY